MDYILSLSVNNIFQPPFYGFSFWNDVLLYSSGSPRFTFNLLFTDSPSETNRNGQDPRKPGALSTSFLRILLLKQLLKYGIPGYTKSPFNLLFTDSPSETYYRISNSWECGKLSTSFLRILLLKHNKKEEINRWDIQTFNLLFTDSPSETLLHLEYGLGIV